MTMAVQIMQRPQTKLIDLFKTFVDKAFIPVLRRTDKADQSLKDWAKFSNLLIEPLNYNELKFYVDMLSPHSFPPDKLQGKADKNIDYKENDSTKKNQENWTSGSDGLSFNVNKTFGGEKYKLLLTANQVPQQGNTHSNMPGSNFNPSKSGTPVISLNSSHNISSKNNNNINQGNNVGHGNSHTNRNSKSAVNESKPTYSNPLGRLWKMLNESHSSLQSLLIQNVKQ